MRGGGSDAKVHVGVIERFQESSSRGTIPLISFFGFFFLPVFALFVIYEFED